MEEIFQYLKKFYLSVTNDKLLLKSYLQKKELSPLPVNVQERILECTVKNSLINKYCPPLTYQKFFLRTVIDVVESYASELSESLIEIYADVLSQPNNDNHVYRSFVITDDCTITLQESFNFVENSTTGLQTWEASKYLLEWCLENASVFKNKKILELGSGVGLLGITLTKLCLPDKYIFTDKSVDVLTVLAKNIEINLEENIVKDVTKKYHLQWGTIRSDDAKSFAVDILIGADVVFDPSVIENLVDTIKIFITHGGAKCAYISNTVRNLDTNNRFLTELGSAGLQYETLDFFESYRFIYKELSKFILYRIFSSERK